MKKIRLGPPFVFFPNGALVALFLLCLALPACKVRIKPPPSTAACTFTINGIFPNCHNPLSSTKSLAYKLAFTVYYYNGSDKLTLDNQTVTSSTTSPAANITVTSKLPNDGTGWSVEVIATGTQCSTCALTQFGSDICNQTIGPMGTTAAKPVLHYFPSETTGYYSSRTITLTQNNRAENAAGSCGCTVVN
jgi:hypothetical protein